MKRALRSIPWLAVLALGLMPQAASACATCFGQSDSDLAKGLNMGILSLLLVVMFVLSGFASFFVYVARRSAAVNRGNIPGEESQPNQTS